MAGLQRYTQKIFGLNAGENEMSEFGSAIVSPPGNTYSGATITPDIIQQLPQYLAGLIGSLGGAYSPPLEDQNSLFRLVTQGLAYIFTRGIPEWDSGTTYNTNDFCKVNNVQYYSLIDSNTNNNPTSSPTEWFSTAPIAPTQQIFKSGSGTYNAPALRPLYIRVQMWGAGGGGQGSGLSSGGGNGSNGGDSTFGSSILIAGGGGGANVSGGAGGTPIINSPAHGFGFKGQSGRAGNSIGYNDITTLSVDLMGGIGGNSLFSGSGQITSVENTGAGGDGGDIITNLTMGTQAQAGGGAGAGANLDAIINNPSSSYLFQIGAGGNGGSAGTSGTVGSDGDDGIIIVTEYYQ